MEVLIDTNVIMDFLMKREPYAEDAIQIVELCREKKLKGYVAAHTVPTLFYILRKDFSIPQRRELLNALCRVFEISEINREKILAALENEKFEDFEDCLQEECAVDAVADYIVTRNPKDFSGSRVQVISPSELLEMLK